MLKKDWKLGQQLVEKSFAIVVTFYCGFNISGRAAFSHYKPLIIGGLFLFKQRNVLLKKMHIVECLLVKCLNTKAALFKRGILYFF